MGNLCPINGEKYINKISYLCYQQGRNFVIVQIDKGKCVGRLHYSLHDFMVLEALLIRSGTSMSSERWLSGIIIVPVFITS